MSRSVKKTIAYGKSTSSRSGRTGYEYMEDSVKKAHKNGTPVPRGHYRSHLQTLKDYRNALRLLLKGNSYYHPDVREKRIKRDFFNFVDNKIGEELAIQYWLEGTGVDSSVIDKLIDEFAYRLYKKDLSK